MGPNGIALVQELIPYIERDLTPKQPNTMKLFHSAAAASLVALLFAACSEPAPCPPPEEHFEHAVVSISPDIDANIAVVEGYLQGLVSADEAAIRGALAPGYYSHNTFLPADSSDADKVVAAWMRNDSTRSDQKVTQRAASCTRVAEGNEFAGDWVHYWGRYSATDVATGKPYVVPFFLNARVENGKMTTAFTYFDRLSVFHQLGTTPPPAPGTDKPVKK